MQALAARSRASKLAYECVPADDRTIIAGANGSARSDAVTGLTALTRCGRRTIVTRYTVWLAGAVVDDTEVARPCLDAFIDHTVAVVIDPVTIVVGSGIDAWNRAFAAAHFAAEGARPEQKIGTDNRSNSESAFMSSDANVGDICWAGSCCRPDRRLSTVVANENHLNFDFARNVGATHRDQVAVADSGNVGTVEGLATGYWAVVARRQTVRIERNEAKGVGDRASILSVD